MLAFGGLCLLIEGLGQALEAYAIFWRTTLALEKLSCKVSTFVIILFEFRNDIFLQEEV